MKKFLVIFLSILAGVCFGVAVSTHLLITGSLGKTYRAYIVQSGSMEPALKVGSIVFTQTASSYSTGDIITFETTSKDNLVTHRIVDVSSENGQIFYQTKGDANEEADNARVPADKIVGKSIASAPYFGYFANFVRTPRGFVIFVVIPAAIIVYEELKAVFNELKKLVLKKKSNTPKTAMAAIIIPVFGSIFLFVSATGSFFNDRESSNTNVLSAASSYETPTPEPTSTPTATTTPTPSQVPLEEEIIDE